MFGKNFVKNIGKISIACLSFGAFHFINNQPNVYLDESKSKVYAWGWNNFGQLGLGHSNNVYSPVKITVFDSYEIAQIASKGSMSAVVTKDGLVFSWGRSKGGILGHQDMNENNLNIPKQIEQLKNIKIKYISCGNNHSAAISEDGSLYTWGNTDHGKLGHSYIPTSAQVSKRTFNDRNINKIGQIQKIKMDAPMSQVVCANQNTVCLSELGDVYSFGQNKKGSLGLKTDQNEIINPTRIQLSEKIVKIDSGADFTIALGVSGKLYAWGSNYFGQLGSTNPLVYETPQIINGFQQDVKIKDFSCGEQFVAAFDQDGRLYTWGYGQDGQLGQPGRQDIAIPRIAEFDQQIKALSCGIGHVALITQSDQLFMLGRGKEGQQGRGTEIESPNTYHIKPCLVESLKDKKIIQVVCGGSHTLALVE